MNTEEAKRVLETALICAGAPLPMGDMRALFDGEVGVDSLRRLLDELVRDWEPRGVELVALASGWRFQSRPEMRTFLDRLHPEKPPKYSRAAMETLAIVAYRQPVTRGDIEDIRGVTVSTQIVRQLEDRGWIDAIGFREGPGRPALYATTRQFLDDLGLASLDQLPAIDSSGDPARVAQALAALNEPNLINGSSQGDLQLESDEGAAAPFGQVNEATRGADADASVAPTQALASEAPAAALDTDGAAASPNDADGAESIDSADSAKASEVFEGDAEPATAPKSAAPADPSDSEAPSPEPALPPVSATNTPA